MKYTHQEIPSTCLNKSSLIVVVGLIDIETGLLFSVNTDYTAFLVLI